MRKVVAPAAAYDECRGLGCRGTHGEGRWAVVVGTRACSSNSVMPLRLYGENRLGPLPGITPVVMHLPIDVPTCAPRVQMSAPTGAGASLVVASPDSNNFRVVAARAEASETGGAGGSHQRMRGPRWPEMARAR
eukprot:3582549-Prymnesium_polylepis.3